MIYRYKVGLILSEEMEVVEWLKWYREVIYDIVMEKRVVSGGIGYLDEFEEDFYLVIRVAYFGFDVEFVEFFFDCFEVEERFVYDMREVLYLVLGRDFFGMVCLVDSFFELFFVCFKKLVLLFLFMDLGNYDMIFYI